jgi:hypothetical protein
MSGCEAEGGEASAGVLVVAPVGLGDVGPSAEFQDRDGEVAECGHDGGAWEDPAYTEQRALLQNIATSLVLAPVRRAIRRGHFKHFRGDLGVDTTAVACWARLPSTRTGLASFEITAGWHHSAGKADPTYGYSATLTVAARRRDTTATERHPQMAVGLVLDTPGTRIGPNALTTLHSLRPLGLPTRLLAADRAYTDQTHEHFAGPARALGYQLVLDYKKDQRGIQGSLHGAPMIDGNLACACTPAPLAHATTGLDDKHIRKPASSCSS